MCPSHLAWFLYANADQRINRLQPLVTINTAVPNKYREEIYGREREQHSIFWYQENTIFNLSPYDFSFTILVTLNEVSSSRMYRDHVRLI